VGHTQRRLYDLIQERSKPLSGGFPYTATLEPLPMNSKPLRVLSLSLLVQPLSLRLDAASPWGPFSVTAPKDARTLVQQDLDQNFDALLLHAADVGQVASALAPEVLHWVHAHATDLAVVLVAPSTDEATAVEYLRLGVQDLLTTEMAQGEGLAARLRAAIERKALEREARKAYATDMGTGLPHQQQLVEHMSHLLALREREPSPMAVLVMRIEGFATVQARYGKEATNVLRRKVAVRLRAGVRASDVVASIGDDSFGVLLAAMLAPQDAKAVGDKLLAALQNPFKLTGHDVAVAAALGVAIFPEDGTQPEVLLRRAVGLAASAPAMGRAGMANFMESGATGAANDED
jgi:diguanylate cyclase (GGDEF)-like protein